MKSITLQKPDGTKFRVNDRRTRPTFNNFQTLSGYLETAEPEMLLPTGFTLQANGEIEIPGERIERKSKNQGQQNQKSDDGKVMLLPAGIEVE